MRECINDYCQRMLSRCDGRRASRCARCVREAREAKINAV
jgi:hypothetical protein